MKTKKATFELTVKSIIMLVIAIVVLFLLIGFIRNILTKSEIKLEQQILSNAPKPTAIISQPFPGVYNFNQQLFFDASESSSTSGKIISYNWDFNNDKKIDSDKINATYKYLLPGYYNVTLKVITDRGAIGTASLSLYIVSNNTKNPNIYSGNLVFMVSTEKKLNILKTLTLTTNSIGSQFRQYPLISYTPNLNETNVIRIIQEYSPDNIIVFDSFLLDSFDVFPIVKKDYNYYPNFWSNYDNAVLVDPDKNENSLVATLYAAVSNMPLFFGNIDHQFELFNLNNRQVYVVGDVDQTVQTYLDNNDYNIVQIPLTIDDVKQIIPLKALESEAVS